MKKIIFILFAMLSVISLFACSDGGDENNGEENMDTTLFVTSFTVTEVNNDYLMATAKDGGQSYRINLTGDTVILRGDKKISPSGITAGEDIDISFSGAVTKSLPPMITANKIVATAHSEDSATTKSDGFIMTARVTSIDEKIGVTVISSEYADGPYFVITSENTIFTNSDGKELSLSDISVGSTIEIAYGGQVMMSYPPQIVAIKITLK